MQSNIIVCCCCCHRCLSSLNVRQGTDSASASLAGWSLLDTLILMTGDPRIEDSQACKLDSLTIGLMGDLC